MASFSLVHQLQLQYSPFEDRLILSTHAHDKRTIRLLITRRLALPLFARLVSFSQEANHWDEPFATQATGSESQAEQGTNTTDTATQRQAQAAPLAEDAFDPLYLATQVHFEQQGEHLAVAFEGLVLPDAMQQAQPHVPVFAFQLNGADLHKITHIFSRELEQARWNESHALTPPFNKSALQ
jgi:hypothetical protein